MDVYEKKRCQNLYWDLLTLSHSNPWENGQYWIRKFEQTKHCDEYHDFSEQLVHIDSTQETNSSIAFLLILRIPITKTAR